MSCSVHDLLWFIRGNSLYYCINLLIKQWRILFKVSKQKKLTVRSPSHQPSLGQVDWELEYLHLDAIHLGIEHSPRPLLWTKQPDFGSLERDGLGLFAGELCSGSFEPYLHQLLWVYYPLMKILSEGMRQNGLKCWAASRKIYKAVSSQQHLKICNRCRQVTALIIKTHLFGMMASRVGYHLNFSDSDSDSDNDARLFFLSNSLFQFF